MNLKFETDDYETAHALWNTMYHNFGRIGPFKCDGMAVSQQHKKIDIFALEPSEIVPRKYQVEIHNFRYSPITWTERKNRFKKRMKRWMSKLLR